MEPKGVWEIVLMSSMPPGRNVVGNRWLLTEKDDGTLRSWKWTVAQGFRQVPGKDFNDSHAPVMTEISFHQALIIRVLMILLSVQFYIKTAFLYSEIDEAIYMKSPEGYVRYMLEVHNKVIGPYTHVLLLKKAIHGLVQAARQ
jgi:Reverse transcriptase (RNA-dependent DNA polymerase)